MSLAEHLTCNFIRSEFACRGVSDLAVEFCAGKIDVGKYNICHDERGRFCSGSVYSRIQAVKALAAKDPRVAEAERLNREGGDSRDWPGVQKDGRYTPEAHAENIGIAESFMNPEAKAREGEAPVAIILLGKPGAGKTTVVRSMGNTTPTTIINSDDIKEKIPGHKPNAAQVTHERSCDIARNYLAPAAIEARHNITFDMTNNQERVLKMVAELKTKGYKIDVVHVHVDNATSAERVYGRFLHTGRYVPVQLALSYGDKPEKAYQALKTSGLVDRWRKYDNSEYGKPPKLLDTGGKGILKRGTIGSLGPGFGGRSSDGNLTLGKGDGGSFRCEDRGFEIADLGVEFSKSNPCHAPSGPKGGQFCETGGGGGNSGMVAAPGDRETWPDHIRALKIPPAWTDVRTNSDPKANLQAIGKDSAGRAQYVYSKSFQESQAGIKFSRIKELDAKFDGIRKQNQGNMKSPDSRIREHAECASLVMTMGIRPGSDMDTKAKVKAYGATILLGKHVIQEGDQVRLRFVGKKGISLDLPVRDRGVASMLRRRADRVGAEEPLFPQVSGGSLLNYTHTLNGGKFKTKDFRTLMGTREAMNQMKTMKAPATAKAYKKSVLGVAKTVAAKLGNTPTVALQSYIHPAVFSAWRVSSAT